MTTDAIANEAFVKGRIDRLTASFPDASFAELLKTSQPMPDYGSIGAVWTREQQDLVDFVLVDATTLLDVAWQPKLGLASLTIIRLDQIVGFDLRIAPNAGHSLGFTVDGDMALQVHTSSSASGAVLVANNLTERKGLTEIARLLRKSLR